MKWFLALGLLCLHHAHAQPYAFSTIAGAAGQRVTTDGTNNSARFYWPRCLGLDAAGNIFVSDDTTLRKITRSGTNWIVTTLAGLPRTSGGIDGTNKAARFDTPSGLALDAATNVFLADYGNHTIRKITPVGTNWIVTTIAGLADVSGSADGTNQVARFLNPFGLVMDQRGHLFVADSGNHTIREMIPDGTNWIVKTLAGLAGSPGSADGTNTVARFRLPRYVAAQTNGVLYVTDRGNATIRQMTPVGSNWVVTTIAGLAGQKDDTDGTNSAARFDGPDGLALDAGNRLYVTDANIDNLRRLTPEGTNWVVTTLGGRAGVPGSADGFGTNALFNYPDCILLDAAGRAFIADRDNYTIRRGVPVLPLALRIDSFGQQVALSWPTGEVTFRLEKQAFLSTNNAWNLVTNAPVETGGRWNVTNPPDTAAGFYQLRTP